jgi:hypothetical protein
VSGPAFTRRVLGPDQERLRLHRCWLPGDHEDEAPLLPHLVEEQQAAGGDHVALDLGQGGRLSGRRAPPGGVGVADLVVEQAELPRRLLEARLQRLDVRALVLDRQVLAGALEGQPLVQLGQLATDGRAARRELRWQRRRLAHVRRGELVE